MKDLTYWIFGSKSSEDTDIMVLVSSISNIKDSKEKVKKYEDILQKKFSKKVNANLAVINKGVITKVYKGTEDEVNNSILDTYHLHKQEFPLTLNKRINRNVELKTIRCLRILLSFLSRTNIRPNVKKALKSDAFSQYELLNKINLAQFNDLSKTGVKHEDAIKTLAFQMGQTLALIKGKELYSKESIYNEYPQLENYLKRKSHCLFPLEVFKQDFLNNINKEELKNKKEIPKN